MQCLSNILFFTEFLKTCVFGKHGNSFRAVKSMLLDKYEKSISDKYCMILCCKLWLIIKVWGQDGFGEKLIFLFEFVQTLQLISFNKVPREKCNFRQTSERKKQKRTFARQTWVWMAKLFTELAIPQLFWRKWKWEFFDCSSFPPSLSLHLQSPPLALLGETSRCTQLLQFGA